MSVLVILSHFWLQSNSCFTAVIAVKKVYKLRLTISPSNIYLVLVTRRTTHIINIKIVSSWTYTRLGSNQFMFSFLLKINILGAFQDWNRACYTLFSSWLHAVLPCHPGCFFFSTLSRIDGKKDKEKRGRLQFIPSSLTHCLSPLLNSSCLL